MEYTFEVDKSIESCRDCPISHPSGYGDWQCELTKLYMNMGMGMPDWCPLIQVGEGG